MESSDTTFIEGVGDEVTVVAGLLVLLLAIVLAWLSTYVADGGDQFLGTIIAVGRGDSIIGLSQVGNTVAQEPAEPPGVVNLPEEKTEEEGDTASGVDPVTRGYAEERRETDGSSDSCLDNLLNIQAVTKRPPSESGAEEHLSQETQEAADISADTHSGSLETGLIKVRLKFLNDTEEIALVRPDDTVAFLKSKSFPGQENQLKLIYQGQLLQDQTRTLRSLNVTDNCVIHCHVSPASTVSRLDTAAVVTEPAGVTLNLSNLMLPIFVAMLAVIWYFRINYRQFFTAPATVSLVGVTVFFSFLVFGMYGR
ncbi:transmembrane and ubiquitin-like domain-containing protein 2 [Ambystoma mexicanum]|uniref:transmembrane and ubiquitin-like domain-containing protein 2 n=1 Tax=Ambystoma mexicanum TaxID=8296 RepID=UPI0037E754DF